MVRAKDILNSQFRGEPNDYPAWSSRRLDEAKSNFHTVGCFIMLCTWAASPSAADWFEWEGLRIELVDTDKNWVDNFLVSKLAV